MKSNVNVNKKHKSSVFSALFSTPETLRELYSAIEGVEVPPDAIVDINTLSNILFMGQINDVSFTIDNRIVVLIEHQSTINENVPLRLLMYIGRIYEKIIDRVKLYQKKLVKIPTPEFIVLYNGRASYPDHQELRLSTAFKNIEDLKLYKNGTSLELIVQVYNINHGRNPQLMEKSETLGGYSIFMDKINEYRNELPLEEAAEAAIKYCIEHNILKQFLKKNSSEVYNMLCEEPTIEEIIQVRVDEAVEERLEQILEEGKLIIARNLLADGMKKESIQKYTGLSLEEIAKL